MTTTNTHALALPLRGLPTLSPVTSTARALNHDLWALLTKAEPLTPDEWAMVEELERQG